MKIIVAGSRTIDNYGQIKSFLDDLVPKNAQIVSGGAVGVDLLGARWALENGMSVKSFIPDWKRHGKRAGHIRNKEMAEYADYLIAFWDTKSAGTRNMIKTMTDLGKPSVVVSLPTKHCGDLYE